MTVCQAVHDVSLMSFIHGHIGSDIDAKVIGKIIQVPGLYLGRG